MERREIYGKKVKVLAVGSLEGDELVVGKNCKSIVEIEDDLGDAIMLWFEVEFLNGRKERYNAMKVFMFEYV